MATTLLGIVQGKGSVVGRIVYEAYHPQRLGRVLSHDGPGWDWVNVLWVRGGTVERMAVFMLQDFESLVLETEKKAIHHRAAFEAAKKVVDRGETS